MQQGFIIASELDRSSLLYVKYNKADTFIFLSCCLGVRSGHCQEMMAWRVHQGRSCEGLGGHWGELAVLC